MIETRKHKNQKTSFLLMLQPISKTLKWKPIDFILDNTNISIDNVVAKMIYQRVADILLTLNQWSSNQVGMNTQINFNVGIPPNDAFSTLSVVYRMKILSLPSPEWKELWSLIKERVNYDPYFRVHGFDKKDVKLAIENLENVFQSSWVKKRYKNANLMRMGDNFDPENEGWFPAYILARTAIGNICIDPGWNYFVELGLAINELHDFSGLRRLVRSLAKSSGTQHHVCLAAEFSRKGMLIGLEPETGKGGASNDLLVLVNNREYAIEVKEFTSGNPVLRLQKEILDKVSKLPSPPLQPVIIHVVVVENADGRSDLDKEKIFFDEINNMTNIPPEISAIVSGIRFIDSSGGRIKRDIGALNLNPNATLPARQEDIDVMFAKNYSKVVAPTFGLRTGFYFGSSNV